MNKTKVTLPVLMATLIKQANSQEIEEEQKAENEVMVANWKAKGTGKGQSSKGANHKERMKKRCTNCKKSRHVKEDCFASGGGKKRDAPDWWKKQQSKKSGPSKSANVAKAKDK
jgi:hypothetical protein